MRYDEMPMVLLMRSVLRGDRFYLPRLIVIAAQLSRLQKKYTITAFREFAAKLQNFMRCVQSQWKRKRACKEPK